jgi:3-isopropylmalate dehydrogenase (EC 1.1.1.85)
MMLQYGLNEPEPAQAIEDAVMRVLAQGKRTGDIMQAGCELVGCKAMGEALLEALE